MLAVDRCDLRLSRGEILVLLGASGCGKSTLLNLIAGFETPDSGTISIRGQIVNDTPSHKRNVALVFQHYALFPHMTVEENVAYGLHARRMRRSDIEIRVTEMMSLLKLTGLGKRYPAQLSGGQRQRAAVARALAIRPDMLLLDEAFSALDRNLREDMQLEFSLLLRRLSVTTVVVTHDQREAFALADRIAVMEHGRIAQIGSPEEVYRNSETTAVFRFLGTINQFRATIVPQPGGSALRVAEGIVFKPSFPNGSLPARGDVTFDIRAEDINVSEAPTGIHRDNPAIVKLRTFLGSQERIVLDFNGQQIVVDRPAQLNFHPVHVDQKVYIDFDTRRCRLSCEG
jgi:ABC-type Fe3+/spermidine/putrescine transport system ATPase subunit